MPAGTKLTEEVLDKYTPGQCAQIVIANDAASVGLTISGAASAAGNLCVRVYDIGKLTQSQTLEVTITHY